MTRAARYTVESATREHFSDFLMNMDKNPVTGFLAKATNIEAIEGSIRNLILTEEGAWPFESSLGSKVMGSLFEFNDPRMRVEIEASIGEVIRNYEPRVKLVGVTVTQGNDPNAIFASLYYSVLNIPDKVFELDVVVTRVR